jgi:hypothetical protein
VFPIKKGQVLVTQQKWIKKRFFPLRHYLVIRAHSYVHRLTKNILVYNITEARIKQVSVAHLENWFEKVFINDD